MNLGHLDFDIVSDLDIRISDFASLAPLHPSRTLYKFAPFYAKQSQYVEPKMNVTAVNTMNNELRTMNYFMQDKPNQTQFFQKSAYFQFSILLIYAIYIDITNIGLQPIRRLKGVKTTSKPEQVNQTYILPAAFLALLR